MPDPTLGGPLIDPATGLPLPDPNAPPPPPPIDPATGAALLQPYQTALGMTGQAAGMLGTVPQVGAPGVSPAPVTVDTNTAQMQEAMRIAQELSGGAIGSSPATTAGMTAWEQLVKPQVTSGLSLTGNLGGGATEEALGLSSTAAAVPLIEQEIANRMGLTSTLGNLGLGVSGQQLTASQATAANQLSAEEANARNAIAAGTANQGAALSAAGQLGALGGQTAQIGTSQYGTYMDSLNQALKAAGIPYDVTSQQGQAAYQDFLRLMGLSEQLNLGPTGQYLAGILAPGQTTTSQTSGGGIFGS